jgi:hypothetical protein
MIKLYTLEDLKDVNIKTFLKVVKLLSKEIGGDAEALIKYTKQADYLFKIDGSVYRRLY